MVVWAVWSFDLTFESQDSTYAILATESWECQATRYKYQITNCL
jgi:hypothetical protein